MKFVKALFSMALTVAFIGLLEIKLGPAPPLGPFLNPSTGFWQNAESKNIRPEESLKIAGLQDEVVIRYDENRIPHLFAKNDHDLYLAQGFVTARDRLWEMDIQTRSASGRLSEIVGPKALDIDRYHRRMGMVFGAENTLKGILKNPESATMVNAYTDGVNDYIHSLAPKDYPLEFKLLNYAPEEWKPINCAFLLKLMSETLAGGSDQFAMTNNLRQFGAKAVNDLFPDYPFHESPIVPEGTQWDFKPLPIPKPSARFMAEMTETIKTHEIMPGVGSNNWAVSGSKTATGYPILANDPHLNLTFPSIWYQLQLSSPTVNVNGASLPGAPCVIIGYNQKISWGVTNVDADVLDWYQIKFKDNTKTEYWYNNRWNKVDKRVEVINILGQKPQIDTVLFTHHGPVVYEDESKKADKRGNIPVGNALRWIAHDESNEFLCFYLLNRGKNYADYRKALTYYTAPAQNFIFASNDNDIAITPNGKFPLKYKDQGKFILDGTDTADDWHGWIPPSQNPTVKNPPRGFVSSANQSPADQTYPYYINWRYESYDRAKRINDKLTAMQKATVDSMRIMQMDNYSMRAHDLLPVMLQDAFRPEQHVLTDNAGQRKAEDIIKHWDNRYDANSIGASIFDAWWHNLYNLTWDEFDVKDVVLKKPDQDRTEKLLLTDPNSPWFDIKATSRKENRNDIIGMAYRAAVDTLVKHYGQPGPKWAWGKVKDTHINHLANVPGLGAGKFAAGGTGMVINALRGGNGPSWRMVVQMGPTVKGYGVFPGGESGNPGSFFYGDMLKTWQDGRLNELLFLKSAEEKSDRVKTTLVLK